GRVHGVGDEGRVRLVVADRLEQSGLAEARRKPRRVDRPGRRLKAVIAAAVVGNQQFAFRVGAEASDLQGRVDQLLIPGDLASLVTNTPDLAGRKIAVEVGAAQGGQLGAVVDDAPGQRAEF